MILVASLNSGHSDGTKRVREISRRFEPNHSLRSRYERSADQKDLLKENILDILDEMMAEMNSDEIEDVTEDDGIEVIEVADEMKMSEDDDEAVVKGDREGKELDRDGKQFTSRSLPLEKCELTGYEIKTREECEEVFEIECNNVTVTKNRTEIINRCMNRIDEKCRVTMIEVPKQKCRPKQEQRYEIFSYV